MCSMTAFGGSASVAIAAKVLGMASGGGAIGLRCLIVCGIEEVACVVLLACYDDDVASQLVLFVMCVRRVMSFSEDMWL